MLVIRQSIAISPNAMGVRMEECERSNFHPGDIIIVDMSQGFVEAKRPGGKTEQMFFEACDANIVPIRGEKMCLYHGHHTQFLPTLLFGTKLHLKKVNDATLPAHIEHWEFVR